MTLGLLVCLAFPASQAFAAAGGLDSGFAGNGKVAIGGPGGVSSAKAVTVQPDGKIIVAGDTLAAGAAEYDATVYRLNPDGSPDMSFDGDGKVLVGGGGGDAYIYALALQPDGKVVVAGITSGPTSADAAVYRLNQDGSPDMSFDGDGKVSIDSGAEEYAQALALQPDGKIVVGGYTSIRDLFPSSDVVVYRLNLDGSPDLGFDADGTATIDRANNEVAYAVALQPDGKIVITGDVRFGSLPGGGQDTVVYRLKPDGGTGAVNGALDTSFDADGVVTIDSGGSDYTRALALAPDGKIVLASHTSSLSGTSAAVYRLKPDGGTGAVNGALDTSFDTDGAAVIGSGPGVVAIALALQPDGRIVVAGNPTVYRLKSNGGTGAVNGALDTSFGTDGAAIIGSRNEEANALALQPDRKIVVAGDRRTATGYDAAVYRLFGDPFLLRVKKSGRGSVATTPSGVACGRSCSHGFDVGTQVTLRAASARDWRFRGWSGASCPGKGPCRLKLSADATIGAAFTPAAFGPDARVTLRLARKRIPARGPQPVRVLNRNSFTVRGKLSGATTAKLAAQAFRVKAHAKRTVRLRLPNAVRRALRHRHKLKLRLTATVKDPAGTTRTVRKRAFVRR